MNENQRPVESVENACSAARFPPLRTGPVLFISNLRHRHPHTYIVLHLAADSTLPLAALMDAGVSGMALKKEPVNALIQVMHAAAAGNPLFSPQAQVKMLAPRKAEEPEVALDDRERQLLRLVCAERSNAEIAEALHTSRKTVERRLSALYKKISVKSRVGAAVWFTRQKNQEDAPAEE